MSSRCFTCMQNKHKQREIAFFFYRMPDFCIVFQCNNKSDSENGRTLPRIPFFNNHHPKWVSERKEKNGLIWQSLLVYACFVGKWNPEVMPLSKLDPLSCIAIHRPKKCPTSVPFKGTISEGKIQDQKRFHHSEQGRTKSLFTQKNIWGLEAL